MAQLDLTGVSIPLVTPFKKDDRLSVDFEKLPKLVDYLIHKQSADLLISIGTTGESTSLTHDEKQQVITETIKAAAGRVPVVVGTGSPCVEDAIELSQFAQKAGAAGLLVVSPCYIRPNQDGIADYFLRISAKTDIPIILYNHPGRTGVPLHVETVVKVANESKNIIGIKDCPNNLARMWDLIRRAKKEIEKPFSVLTGEDDFLFVNLCLGGAGSISAACHVVGNETRALIDAFHAGNIEEARRVQESIVDLQRLLFDFPNPAPIKTCLDLMGPDLGGKVRSPLADAPADFVERLKGQLRRNNKI